ncbi:hypothetical protein LINPERPRIM_LOCUS33466 [Linum perenne]
MNILAWNCQGLGSSLTSSSLKTLCRKTRPDILFLSETKNMSSLVSQKLSSLNFHNFQLVDPRGLSGGLALAWSSSVSCVVLDCAHFFIAVDVTFPQNINVTTIGVYLSCDWHERSQQLDFLSSFCASLSKPFIIFGDFNAILSNCEKISHSSWNASRSIQSFQNFVNQLSLFDFHPGPFFTWTNKQDEQVQSRLDRFLPPHVGRLCSPKAQCDTSMIWAWTTERLHGSLLFLVTHLDNTSLMMFVGIKMRKFVTLYLRFGTTFTQLALVCSLSKQSFMKFVASLFNRPIKEKLILLAVSVPSDKPFKSFETPTWLTGTESDHWKVSSTLL